MPTRRTTLQAALGAACAAASPAPSSWWEDETRMERGVLSFREKPWFREATELPPGRRIYLDLNKDGRPDAMVFRDGAAIVEVIDDGLRWNSQTAAGDFVDSCWVIDYDGDGLVDRMIDYTDNNADGIADEVEFRYFDKGRLVWSWLFECLDGRWNGWTGWPYDWPLLKLDHATIPCGKTTEVFARICRGNKSYAINKYDPGQDAYIPFSECPFAFFDLDRDGRSEAVVRVSAGPLDAYQPVDRDPAGLPRERWDYANSYAKIWGPVEPAMQRMGNLNVRYSFNIKNQETDARPLAYDVGFTMIGSAPYQYRRMHSTNPRRRHPKTFVRVDHADARQMAENYPAEATGFSWDEWGDSTLAGGTRPVWEGVFWIYERHVLFNTGGPSRKWNIRREFHKGPSRSRKLYYSEIDKRIHLAGAQDGWMEIGHVAAGEKIGEIRYFDTDGDGYFDRWEYDLDNDGRPERIVTVANPKARNIAFDYGSLSGFYTAEVLPNAIAENQRLIAAFKQHVALADSPALQVERAAAEAESAERKRYLLDVVREYYYQALLNRLYQASGADPYAAVSREGKEPRASWERGFDSERWWRRAAAITALDHNYNNADYGAVFRYLEELRGNP